MAENLHGAVKILRQRGLEILSPARRSRWESAESKAYGREIEARVESASAVEANFLWIEFVKIVQHAAHRVAFVVVERVLKLPGHNAAAVEHQIFSYNPARICQPVGKLFIGGE